MATFTIESIHTDAAYASLQAERTSVAYWHARDFQDIVHEMTQCTGNGLFGRACGMCMGCTFRTFLTSDPKRGTWVLKYVIQEFRDETSETYNKYNSDMSGLGGHIASFAALQVDCDNYQELADRVYKFGMGYARANGCLWPTSDISNKARNENIWDMFAELVLDHIN